MGSLKNNIRSFRFSDEVKNILEKQDGSNLNEKFENLILLCFWQRDSIISEIDRLQAYRDTLKEDITEYRERLRQMSQFETLIRRTESSIKNYVDSLESYCNTK